MVEAERLCQIGRFEEVAVGQGADELGEVALGLDHYVGLAMWLRGEAPPELAFELVDGLVRQIESTGPLYATVAGLTVATKITLTVGETDRAREWAERSANLESAAMASGVRSYCQLARALVALHDGNTESVEAVGLVMPSGKWVWQSGLLALPEIYLHRPELRFLLDNAALGSTTGLGRAVDQTLVQLLEGSSATAPGTADLAAALPWDNSCGVRLLRSTGRALRGRPSTWSIIPPPPAHRWRSGPSVRLGDRSRGLCRRRTVSNQSRGTAGFGR